MLVGQKEEESQRRDWDGCGTGLFEEDERKGECLDLIYRSVCLL